eukprot:3591832-Alexandrium_andersonii.AAC.1
MRLRAHGPLARDQAGGVEDCGAGPRSGAPQMRTHLARELLGLVIREGEDDILHLTRIECFP